MREKLLLVLGACLLSLLPEQSEAAPKRKGAGSGGKPVMTFGGPGDAGSQTYAAVAGGRGGYAAADETAPVLLITVGEVDASGGSGGKPTGALGTDSGDDAVGAGGGGEAQKGADHAAPADGGAAAAAAAAGDPTESWLDAGADAPTGGTVAGATERKGQTDRWHRWYEKMFSGTDGAVLDLLRRYDPATQLFGDGNEVNNAKNLTSAVGALSGARKTTELQELLKLCREKGIPLDGTARRKARTVLRKAREEEQQGLLASLAALQTKAQQEVARRAAEIQALRQSGHATYEFEDTDDDEPALAHFASPQDLLRHTRPQLDDVPGALALSLVDLGDGGAGDGGAAI